MQKRRERIEQWRAERKKNQDLPTVPLVVPTPTKKWTLEDDDDEEEETSGEKKTEDDEIDPLDAYMQVNILFALFLASNMLWLK